ncbi:tetratricopeptide repeat protein [Undibacterium arcticum]|uniref:Tetratricopeptide repeat protein n=1 Tax=Undibacterium arcticum TaxID=1762892 RepID=A0ABV7F8W4_9BURK
MKSITIADLHRKYGLPRRIVTELVKQGFVVPTRGKSREYRFNFHDVVILRMAHDLAEAGFSPKKTTRFLNQLRRDLPASSVAGMRISAAGKELVVREDGRLRSANGQLVIEFAEAVNNDTVTSFPVSHKQIQGADRSAGEWYNAALSIEASDPLKAIHLYRKAIEVGQRYAEAFINLGCILIEREQYLEAFAVCQEGVLQCPDEPFLHFNLGVVYEELKRFPDALGCYNKALHLDSKFADAHYNAARLHETMGHSTAAIRHFNEYRRLAR